MPLPDFKPSASLSMGVELELQLVNVSDFDLAAASADLMDVLGRQPFPGMVTPEITQGMIEVATDVHHRHDELLAQLQQMRAALVQGGDLLNIGIGGGGTHPFQTWPDQRITRKPRFHQLSSLYGYLAKQFTIFGQHVHIGCRDGDEALYLLHALSRYIPHFIALSASSPFSHGHDTQFQSSRLNAVYAFPLSGRAPFMTSWAAFAGTFFTKMERTGVVAGMKDFYWDIRPKPEYGTIELRVCDTPLAVERAAALAGYLQVLCHHLLHEVRVALDEDAYLVYNYNRFQACRFGLEGVLVDPASYETISVREDVLSTLRRIEASAASLDADMALAHIEQIAHGEDDASLLRKVFASHGSLEGVVEQALTIFRTGSPD